MESTPLPPPDRLRAQIAIFTSIRTVQNTGYRMVYPFLPVIARGLGVELMAVTQAVSARSLLGFLAPLLGSVADVWGRRAAMLIGLGLFAAGMALIVVWPTLPALFAGLILGAAGKGVFDPGMQAFVGDRVPYERRGTALAITEMSWSAAFLFGVPAAGWLIARSDWRAPFPWLAALGIVAALVIGRLIPADAPSSCDARPSLVGSLRTVIMHPVAVGALAVALGISTANEVVNVVFGAWIEGAFRLQVAALGAASAVIGLSELGGEGLVAALVDRVGKRRAVAAGIALNAGACLLLPFMGFSLTGALAGLFLFYLTFEFSVVASVPLLSELVPGARATMMAGYGAAFSLGRALGAWVGPLLFAGGMQANGMAGAILDGLALAMLLLVVQQE